MSKVVKIIYQWSGETSENRRASWMFSRANSEVNPIYIKIQKEGKRLSSYSKFYLHENTLYEYMKKSLYRSYWDKCFKEIPISDSRHYIIKVKFFKEKKISIVNRFELMDLDE
ncbi:hypothetical protein LCGC14_3160000 [marine sediment metagenome]|uniref:Uncharacterized protein n=1 Tax=marine sediment metagenome TaxID=412755 RepID=A0A0F8VRI8_9ZZZZ